MNPESRIIVFTDGSSRGNPGPGGFGAIIIAPKNYELGITNYEIKEIGGREEHTTNNRMELQAAISALSFLRTNDYHLTIIIYSDSSYLINGITKWVYGWQKNGWKTATKKEVENRDLWERLVELTAIYRSIDWKLVGGHVGVAGNERCDEVATAFADGKKVELYSGVLKNYRIKNILDISFDVSQEKKKALSRSKRAAYSYVSMVDGAVQTYQTWAECERRAKGKSGARFKKVFSAGEEEAVKEKFRQEK